MRRELVFGDIKSGALDEGRVRLRTEDADGSVDLLFPLDKIQDVAMMLIRIASDAAREYGDDTLGGFVVDSVDMSEPDDDGATVLRLWSLTTPTAFLIDQTLMVELQYLAQSQLEAIRKPSP